MVPDSLLAAKLAAVRVFQSDISCRPWPSLISAGNPIGDRVREADLSASWPTRISSFQLVGFGLIRFRHDRSHIGGMATVG